MWNFLKFALVVSIGAVVFIPLIKMGVDFAAQKVSALGPVATYVDKA